MIGFAESVVGIAGMGTARARDPDAGAPARAPPPARLWVDGLGREWVEGMGLEAGVDASWHSPGRPAPRVRRGFFGCWAFRRRRARAIILRMPNKHRNKTEA